MHNTASIDIQIDFFIVHLFVSKKLVAMGPLANAVFPHNFAPNFGTNSPTPSISTL